MRADETVEDVRNRYAAVLDRWVAPLGGSEVEGLSFYNEDVRVPDTARMGDLTEAFIHVVHLADYFWLLPIRGARASGIRALGRGLTKAFAVEP